MDPAPASASLFFSIGLLPVEGSPDFFKNSGSVVRLLGLHSVSSVSQVYDFRQVT